MLNSYSSSNSNNNIHVNAITGTLVKNYKDSFFYHFHLNSYAARTIFDDYENPHLTIKGEYGDRSKPVVVIQSMVCGDMEVICEIMWKDDFDKMFNKDNEISKDGGRATYEL